MRNLISVILSWLEEKSRWSRLRGFGGSGLVKASVLMPVFGYLLLLNDNVHQFLEVKYDGLGLHFLHLPSTWRIWMLFYGTFLIAIGSILFSTNCAPEIKRYMSAYDMATAERNHIAAQNQTQKARDDLKKLYQNITAWESELFPSLDFDHRFFGSETTDAESQILIFRWTVLDRRRPRVRVTVLALFAIGSVLVAFPALVTFLQVTGHGLGVA